MVDVTISQPLENSSVETTTFDTFKTTGEDIAITTNEELVITTGESLTNCSHCLSNKYLKHYYAKGCKPIFDDNCNDCPKFFDCDKKVEIILANDGSSLLMNCRIVV